MAKGKLTAPVYVVDFDTGKMSENHSHCLLMLL